MTSSVYAGCEGSASKLQGSPLRDLIMAFERLSDDGLTPFVGCQRTEPLIIR